MKYCIFLLVLTVGCSGLADNESGMMLVEEMIEKATYDNKGTYMGHEARFGRYEHFVAVDVVDPKVNHLDHVINHKAFIEDKGWLYKKIEN